MSSKTIAVDFDGVLHRYSDGWQGGKIYDEPMEGAVRAIKLLQIKGYRLVVFTARESLDPVRAWIKEWFGSEFVMEVTNKKPQATAYIDDRAIRFTNWKDVLNYF